METLIFLLVISTTNLVFCDDNAAIENNTGYEVQEEIAPENDQLAEGSQIISHTYGQNVVGANLKDTQGVRQTLQHPDNLNRNGDVRYTYEIQNVHQQPQQQIKYLHDIRHKPIVVNEGGHPVQSQAYSQQEQQMGVRHPIHPAQLYAAAQGSPSQQGYGNEHAIGYQSYVEHVPKAEEEEIKSALKENTMGDIKRLVPKSGISFKIYHHEKTPNVKVTEHKIETQPEVSTITTQAAQGEFHNAVLHHRVKVQTPVQQLQVQTHEQQENPQQIYIHQNIDEQHRFANQVGNGLHDQQAVYYTQQEVSTQRPLVHTEQEVNSPRPVVYTQHEVNSPRPIVYTQQEISSPRPVVYTQQQISSPNPVVYAQQEISSPRPVVYTHHEISSQRPALEVTGKGAVDSYKFKIKDDNRATSKVEFNKNTGMHNHLRHHGRKNYHKIAKQLKPENAQYMQKELMQGVQKLALSQNEGLGSYVSEGGELFADLKGAGNYIAQQEQGKVGQFLHKQTNQPILNRLSGNFISEGVKTASVVNLGTSAYSDYKNVQGNGYADSDGAKVQQAVSYGVQFDTQSTPNNFDHKKALEGSTSFDIKNAIGNSQGAEHQTAYVTTTEIHPNEQFQKQQLTYNLPVTIDNAILKTPIEGQQIKFGQMAVPQFTFSQDINGKLYQQPQFVWTTEHIKQGKEIHQPMIQLHFPKEEIQYVKTQKVEIPGIITHQQQPLLIQQNYKPQEIHFQHKKPQQYQPNLKLSQPVIIDWSLFKSKFPNVNINSLAIKPELVSYVQDPNKKILPILVRKRKNRSNKEAGVVYGKATNRGPAKPTQRQEKNIHLNLLPSASNDVKLFDTTNESKNEFSVSASYKVDRNYKSSASK